MPQTLHVRDGKRQAPAVNAEAAPGLRKSRRLFVRDQHDNTRYLIDTGADASVILQIRTDLFQPSDVILFAANATRIPSYGSRLVTLDLGLRRKFTWPFIIADVSKPIIGTDFLFHAGLLVDIQEERLLYGTTNLSTRCTATNMASLGLKLMNSTESVYHELLAKFPAITRPNLTQAKRTHSVTYHIRTNGPPSAARPRRLPPDKLAAAHAEFEHMVAQGLARPSDSP